MLSRHFVSDLALTAWNVDTRFFEYWVPLLRDMMPCGPSRDFRFACPRWHVYTPESRGAHEILFGAQSSSSRGRHLSPRWICIRLEAVLLVRIPEGS